MANAEHVEILKQSVEAWNKWRIENPAVKPDLSGADLSGANLSRADLFRANLSGANLSDADLSGANLSGADLSGADLYRADLSGANLYRADLSGANLSRADLSGANLSGANLYRADLSLAILDESILDNAHMGWTIFGNVDLSSVHGLETVTHIGPSTIGIDTIYRSGGKIPEELLKGCGVQDNFVDYIGSLVGRAIEYYSCFISYSSKDEEFAVKLHRDLQAEGVRCWFAPEDMKIGDRIRDEIDQAIRFHDKLLLILSEQSVESDWVESEVESAFEQERKRTKKSTVLFPIRIDDAVMEADVAWAGDIRRTRHIGDFSNWKDHDTYKKAFERLLRDLKGETKVD